MGKLEGRTALVTGGSRGIGRAVSLRFAREGANVAINYASNEAQAREVAEEARGLGVRAEIYQADVADPAAVSAMCEQAVADFGQIDALGVGCASSAAGRFLRRRPPSAVVARSKSRSSARRWQAEWRRSP